MREKHLAALRNAATGDPNSEPRWSDGDPAGVRGRVRLTFMADGSPATPRRGDALTGPDPAVTTISVELPAIELAHINLGAFRSAAAELLDIAGVSEARIDRGLVVAEVHPGSLRDSDGRFVKARPEVDDQLLRTVAGYRLYPAEWLVTTTSRDYRALVGPGELVIVAWSGNRWFWSDNDRDRTFREFGDDRTLDVARQVLRASTAMVEVHQQLGGIAQRVEEIAAEVGAEDSQEAPTDHIATVHADIRATRATLHSAVLQHAIDHKVQGTPALRRLGGLHDTLTDELIPDRVIRQLDSELASLLHDVEFALARRTENNMLSMVQGSEDAARARFLQSVVLLILAGAALFTGLMTIPDDTFAGSYNIAGLWSLMTVLGSVIVGFVLYKLYRRRPRLQRVTAPGTSAMVAAATLIAALGLAEAIAANTAFLIVLGLTAAAALLVAWHQPGDRTPQSGTLRPARVL